MLAAELLVQETYLGLGLLLGSLSFRQFIPMFRLHLLFLCSQSFKITSEHLGISLDASEVGFKGCDSACNIRLLDRHAVFLLFATL
jgi:hypothetical protein